MPSKQKHAHGVVAEVLAAVWLFFTPAISLAQGDTWTKKADMPTARLGLATSVVDGRVYAIGGYREANAPGMQTVEEYDPATNTWTAKANMPTGRRQLSTSVGNGRIFAIGGYVNYREPGLSTVEEYDPVTDTWTTKAPMPTARLGLATSVVNGIVYAIGGASRVPQPLRTVEAYDPLTDTWTMKADMPTARFFFSTSVVDGKIYAIGGSYGSLNQVLSTVEAFHPAMNTWSSKTGMPGPRWGLSTSTVNGQIYAIGGAAGDAILSTAEAYDPATDTWATLTGMPEGRGGVSTSTVNGRIYAIGGALTFSPPHPGVPTVEEYDTGFVRTIPDKFVTPVAGSDKSVPSASVLTLDGDTLKLAEICKEKPTFLYFWATWCKVCSKDMKEVFKLEKEFGDEIQVFGIAWKDSAARVEAYFERKGQTLHSFLDADGSVFEAFGITRTPGVAIVGSDGKVAFLGYGSFRKFRRLLRKEIKRD